jgi:hypothetical protein
MKKITPSEVIQSHILPQLVTCGELLTYIKSCVRHYNVADEPQSLVVSYRERNIKKRSNKGKKSCLVSNKKLHFKPVSNKEFSPM